MLNNDIEKIKDLENYDKFATIDFDRSTFNDVSAAYYVDSLNQHVDLAAEQYLTLSDIAADSVIKHVSSMAGITFKGDSSMSQSDDAKLIQFMQILNARSSNLLALNNCLTYNGISKTLPIITIGYMIQFDDCKAVVNSASVRDYTAYLENNFDEYIMHAAALCKQLPKDANASDITHMLDSIVTDCCKYINIDISSLTEQQFIDLLDKSENLITKFNTELAIKRSILLLDNV